MGDIASERAQVHQSIDCAQKDLIGSGMFPRRRTQYCRDTSPSGANDGKVVRRARRSLAHTLKTIGGSRSSLDWGSDEVGLVRTGLSSRMLAQ